MGLPRAGWWLAAGVGACLMLPATASAAWTGSPASAALAASRDGLRPTGKVHVIAARRHGHLVWYSRSARQRSHRSLTLSRITGFTQRGVRTVTSVPTITVTETGGSCINEPYAPNTNDSIAWIESYAPSLWSDVSTCQLNDGQTTMYHQELPNPVDCYGWKPYWESDNTSPTENAQFPDGEYISICNVPDDNGAGGSNANNSPFTYYNQGFSCGAVAGVGSNDNTVYRAKGNDSIEFFQNYVDYGGNPTQAITTSCMGVLPSSVTVSSAIVAHFLACYETNPNPGGGTLLGYGETVTFPDRQYSETCTIPNYHPVPALT